MNRKSALSALQTISAKVGMCTQSDVCPEAIASLECAAKELWVAIQGDAYAKERTEDILQLLRRGFLSPTSKSTCYRQEILVSVKALYSYVSRRPDSQSETLGSAPAS